MFPAVPFVSLRLICIQDAAEENTQIAKDSLQMLTYCTYKPTGTIVELYKLICIAAGVLPEMLGYKMNCSEHKEAPPMEKKAGSQDQGNVERSEPAVRAAERYTEEKALSTRCTEGC